MRRPQMFVMALKPLKMEQTLLHIALKSEKRKKERLPEKPRDKEV